MAAFFSRSLGRKRNIFRSVPPGLFFSEDRSSGYTLICHFARFAPSNPDVTGRVNGFDWLHFWNDADGPP